MSANGVQIIEKRSHLHVGEIIANQYEVQRCLGFGSMGIVYLCRDLALDQPVALKVLSATFAQREDLLMRFKNEALSLFAVNSPHVVRISSFVNDDSITAYTMEYVPGCNLSDVISRIEGVEIGDAVHYLAQIASGLREIHSAQILHRDLKPSNILIDLKGRAKISDLGIARTMHGDELPDSEAVVGTLNYISPEYLRDGLFIPASDIYAVGVIAYELLTKLNPIKADSFVEALQRCLTPRQLISPDHFNRECPKELSRIVLRALSFDPAARHQTAQELLSDLHPLTEKYEPSLVRPNQSNAINEESSVAKQELLTSLTARLDKLALSEEVDPNSTSIHNRPPTRIRPSLNLKQLAKQGSMWGQPRRRVTYLDLLKVRTISLERPERRLIPSRRKSAA